MNIFLWNIILAFTWSFMAGEVTATNLLVGFVLGYFTLRFIRGRTHAGSYFRKFWQVLGFFFWFAWQLFLSNLRVAYDVMTPGYMSHPGTVAIPLEVETPLEITLLANLITLTPGTLSLDVSDDRKTLYIHAMYIDSPEEVRREIKEGMERKVLELMR